MQRPHLTFKDSLGISPKVFRQIYHPKLDISLDLYNFLKEVSQLTDCQIYKKIFGNIVPTLKECLQQISEEIYYPELEMYLYLSNFSKEVKQLKD